MVRRPGHRLRSGRPADGGQGVRRARPGGGHRVRRARPAARTVRRASLPSAGPAPHQDQQRLGEGRGGEGHEDEHGVERAGDQSGPEARVESDQFGEAAGAEQHPDGAGVIASHSAQPRRAPSAAHLDEYGEQRDGGQGEQSGAAEPAHGDVAARYDEEEGQQQRRQLLQGPHRDGAGSRSARSRHPRQQGSEDHVEPEGAGRPGAAAGESHQDRRPVRGVRAAAGRQPAQQRPGHEQDRRGEQQHEEQPQRHRAGVPAVGVEQGAEQDGPAQDVDETGGGYGDHSGQRPGQPVLPHDGRQDRDGSHGQGHPQEQHGGQGHPGRRPQPHQFLAEAQGRCGAQGHGEEEGGEGDRDHGAGAPPQDREVQLVPDQEQEDDQGQLGQSAEHRPDLGREQQPGRAGGGGAQQGRSQGDPGGQLPDDHRLPQPPCAPPGAVGDDQDHGGRSDEVRDHRVRAHGTPCRRCERPGPASPPRRRSRSARPERPRTSAPA